MAITPPNTSPKRELARKLFDATISGIPLVGGHFAALYSVTHRPQSEVDEALWRNEVSQLLNSIEEALDFVSGSIALSEDAISIGIWLSEVSEDGRRNVYGLDQIVERYSEATISELQDALGELDLEGMISISHSIGRPISSFRTTHRLYETFDPIVFQDTSPRADAAFLAQRLLGSPNDGLSAQQVCDECGWSIRRINPALAIVGEFIDEGRKSQPVGQPFTIRSMFTIPRERIALKRFIAKVEKPN